MKKTGQFKLNIDQLNLVKKSLSQPVQSTKSLFEGEEHAHTEYQVLVIDKMRLKH